MLLSATKLSLIVKCVFLLGTNPVCSHDESFNDCDDHFGTSYHSMAEDKIYDDLCAVHSQVLGGCVRKFGTVLSFRGKNCV